MLIEERSRSDSKLGNHAHAIAEDFRRARLGAEVLGTYLRVRWLVLRRGEVSAVSILRRELSQHATAEPRDTRVLRGLRLARAVVRVLRLVPTDSRCLMRSLVLARMLARRGVYAKVVIGVRPEPSFAAHAWVEVDGEPVLATDESTYRRLVEL
jgi:hypothetical protein